MTKRVPAILFILLANIILLAHGVISHHHINGTPSFVILHHDHHSDHDDSTKHHDEEKSHHDEEDSKRCILKLSFFSPSDAQKSDNKSVEFSGKTISDHALPFGYERSSVAIQLFLSLSPPHDLSSRYCVYVDLGIGLRAPPVG